MTTPKEALETARTHLITLGGDPRSVIAEYGSPSGDEIQGAVLDVIDQALATGLVPDEAEIRADEREKCAKELQSRADGFNEKAATSHTREVRASSLSKASALIDAAAAIRSGGGE